MKRFVFPQEGLLRVKKQLQRQAELGVASAHSRWMAALSDETAWRERRDTYYREQQPARGRAVQAFLLTRQGAAYLDDCIAAARLKVSECEQKLTEAQAVLRAISAEVESLETLRHQHWKEYRRRRESNRQGFVDEMALALWQRNLLNVGEGSANG